MSTAICLALALASMGQAQFEVVSIHPAAPPAPGEGVGKMISRGGPGTRDPTHYSCSNCSLSAIVSKAYNLKTRQLSAPAWMNTRRFDVAAKVPASTTYTMDSGIAHGRMNVVYRHPQQDTVVVDRCEKQPSTN